MSVGTPTLHSSENKSFINLQANPVLICKNVFATSSHSSPQLLVTIHYFLIDDKVGFGLHASGVRLSFTKHSLRSCELITLLFDWEADTAPMSLFMASLRITLLFGACQSSCGTHSLPFLFSELKMCKLIVELLSFTLFVGWFNKTFPGFQTSKIAYQTLQQMQLEQKLWRECQLVTRPKLWSSQRHISRYLN